MTNVLRYDFPLPDPGAPTPLGMVGPTTSAPGSPRTRRHRRRPPAPNIGDRFIDLLAPLTRQQRNALIQLMSDDYYIQNRAPSRQDVIALIDRYLPGAGPT